MFDALRFFSKKRKTKLLHKNYEKGKSFVRKQLGTVVVKDLSLVKQEILTLTTIANCEPDNEIQKHFYKGMLDEINVINTIITQEQEQEQKC